LENRVLTNVQLFLVVFNLPEHITDCLTLFRKSQVEKLRTLLHQLNLAEQLREQSNYLKAVLLNVDVGCQVSQADLAIALESLKVQITADTFFSHLTENDIVDSCFRRSVNSLL